jgi:hypothetical protein
MPAPDGDGLAGRSAASGCVDPAGRDEQRDGRRGGEGPDEPGRHAFGRAEPQRRVERGRRELRLPGGQHLGRGGVRARGSKGHGELLGGEEPVNLGHVQWQVFR